MALLNCVSCNKISASSCPVAITPSEQALHEAESVIDTKPALYDYIDAIGVREEFIVGGCR